MGMKGSYKDIAGRLRPGWFFAGGWGKWNGGQMVGGVITDTRAFCHYTILYYNVPIPMPFAFTLYNFWR